MVLMNLDDLEGVVHEAARVLDSGGHFCIAITHPINTAGKFETREPGSAFVITEAYFQPHRNDLRTQRHRPTITVVDLPPPLPDYSEALERPRVSVKQIPANGGGEEPS